MMTRNLFGLLLAIGLTLVPPVAAEDVSTPAPSNEPVAEPESGESQGSADLGAKDASESEPAVETAEPGEASIGESASSPLCKLIHLPQCGPCGNAEPDEPGTSPVLWDGKTGVWIGLPRTGSGLSFGSFENYQHFGIC